MAITDGNPAVSVHESRPVSSEDAEPTEGDAAALRQRVLSLRLPRQESTRGSRQRKGRLGPGGRAGDRRRGARLLAAPAGIAGGPRDGFTGKIFRRGADGILRQHRLGFQGLHHARAADPRQPEGQRHDRQARYPGRPPGEEGRRSGRVGRRRLQGRPGPRRVVVGGGPAAAGRNRGHAAQRGRPGQGRVGAGQGRAGAVEGRLRAMPASCI